MKRLSGMAVLLVLLLSWAAPTLAGGDQGGPGRLVFGRDLTLNAGDAVSGDVVIFGGNLMMAEGSRVDGNAVVFGGTAEVNGEVNGDVVGLGGTVRLGAKAHVNGDVSAMGGDVYRDPGAVVRGNTEFNLGRLPFTRPRWSPFVADAAWFDILGEFVRSVQAVVLSAVVAAIGLLVLVFLPQHSQVVARTITGAAPASFGVGLLTLIAGAAVTALLFLTCLLIPVGLLVALAVGLGSLFGWVVVGYLAGRRLMPLLQKGRAEPTPAMAALVGVFVVTLVQQGLMVLGHIPCLGFMFGLLGVLLWLAVASIGLGAVVLSRLGTQVYLGTPPVLPPGRPAPPHPPVPPIEPPAPAAPPAPPAVAPPEQPVPAASTVEPPAAPATTSPPTEAAQAPTEVSPDRSTDS
jgi:cytoskeletal protein CcmA (bactofilin family)